MFEGHYCKIMKYDFLEVELLRGAIIAKTGKDDLYSRNMQSILQGAGVCPQSTRSVESRKDAVSKPGQDPNIQGFVWPSFMDSKTWTPALFD